MSVETLPDQLTRINSDILRAILTSQGIDPNQVGFARYLSRTGRSNENDTQNRALPTERQLEKIMLDLHPLDYLRGMCHLIIEEIEVSQFRPGEDRPPYKEDEIWIHHGEVPNSSNGTIFRMEIVPQRFVTGGDSKLGVYFRVHNITDRSYPITKHLKANYYPGAKIEIIQDHPRASITSLFRGQPIDVFRFGEDVPTEKIPLIHEVIGLFQEYLNAK